MDHGTLKFMNHLDHMLLASLKFNPHTVCQKETNHEGCPSLEGHLLLSWTIRMDQIIS